MIASRYIVRECKSGTVIPRAGLSSSYGVDEKHVTGNLSHDERLRNKTTILNSLFCGEQLSVVANIRSGCNGSANTLRLEFEFEFEGFQAAIRDVNNSSNKHIRLASHFRLAFISAPFLQTVEDTASFDPLRFCV